MILANGFDRSKARYVAFTTIVHEPESYIAAAKSGGAATASAVIALADHTFAVGDRVIRQDSGTGWTEVPAGVPLFVVAIVAATSISVSLTEGGTAITATGSAGVFHKCAVFHVNDLANDSQTPSFAYVKRRGMSGLKGNVAQQINETTSEWTWVTDQPDDATTLFGGADVGQSLGYSKIYQFDPADAATVARKVSERFYSSITSDKAANDGDDKFSEPSLKLTALKPDGSIPTYTKNVTVAA